MKKVVVVLLIIVLTGCGYNSVMSTTGHLESIKRVSSLDESVILNLNNFGMNLYDELYEEEKNVFISPASVYLAMSMVYNGTSGQTKKEMSKVLNIANLSLEKFNKLNRDLQYLILGYKNSKFEFANSIWINDMYSDSVKKEFIDRNNEYYGTIISSLDFSDNRSVNTINDWVKNNTKGRIEKIIERSNIDQSVLMYLINTIYFKAKWEKPFENDNTKIKPFTNSSGTKNVRMMNKSDNLGYVENDSFQGVLLPYNDDRTAMFVLLPKEGEKATLSQMELTDLLNEAKSNVVEVELSMPRVKVEYDASLIEALKKLGIENAFSNSADFSNMSNGKGIYISEVTHKTFLDVNEEGTEASAVTSVEIYYSGPSLSGKSMNVNRPFIIYIIDKKSNSILFIGRVFSPK